MGARTPRPRKAAAPSPGLAPAGAGLLVRSADLPWFPFLRDSIHLKLCHVNRATGEIALIVRVAPGGDAFTHYHHGTVVAYTIAGQWRHRETGRVGGAGDVLVEPAGTTRTLEAVGEVPAEVFVHITGALEFRDASGRTLCIENAETLHGRYLAHCALHGIAPAEVSGP